MRANLENALGCAAEIAARHDFVLLLEPLNVTVDHHGYYLSSAPLGADIVRAVGSPHLRLLFDIYHMQIMAGNLISTIRKLHDVIGHYHAAGVPGRAELFGTEINYPGRSGRHRGAGLHRLLRPGIFPGTRRPSGVAHAHPRIFTTR